MYVMIYVHNRANIRHKVISYYEGDIVDEVAAGLCKSQSAKYIIDRK